MTLALILIDPLHSVAYNVSEWAELAPLAEQLEATGRAATLDLTLRSYQLNVGAIPVVPVPGLLVACGDDNAYPGNPDPWSYLFTGKVVVPKISMRVDGLGYVLTCEDWTRELNTPVPRLVFTGDDQPTDVARITALFAAADLPGVWDAITFVGGPFTSYPAGTETPYAGKVSDILLALATDPGGDVAVQTTLGTGVAGAGVATVTPASMIGIHAGRVLTIDASTGSAEDLTVTSAGTSSFTATFIHSHLPTATVAGSASPAVPPRKFFTGAYWTNPADYSAGLTRYVSYYGADALPPDPVPLTDDPTGLADYAFDTFPRGNTTLTLGTAESGQAWDAQIGQWGVNNGYGYLPAGASAANLAIIASTLSDGILEVTLHVVGPDTGIGFRAAADGGNIWAGWAWMAHPASNQYTLYKRAAGNYTLVDVLNVTPTAGDLLRVTLAGSSVTGEVVRGGISQGTVSTTDAFQQGATWHGLTAAGPAASARWAAFRLRGPGTVYEGLVDTEDAAGLANVLLVRGPAVAPAPATWDAVLQPPVGVSATAGALIKTALTDAWDAGASTAVQFASEGGEVVFSTETRSIGQDTFTRPDAAYLGGLESGQDWQRYNAAFAWGISSGTAYCRQPGGSGLGIAVMNAGAGTCIVECRLSTLVTSASRLCVRVSDENNCLLVLPAASRYELYRRQAGVLTLLASGGGTPASGDTVKIDLAESLVQVYINGVYQFQATETFNQTVPWHGIGTTSGGGAARWDNFSVRQTYATRTVGLRAGASAPTRQVPDFGIAFTAARHAQVTEGGTLVGTVLTYGAGWFWRIALDASTRPAPHYAVTYSYREPNSARWVVWYTSPTHPDPGPHPLHTDVALYHAGSSITNLTIEPYNGNVFTDDVSINTYDLWPAGDVVQDDSLDTYAKRAAHAAAYFAEHADLRKSYALTVTERRYQAGMTVLFTCLRLGIVNARKTVVQAKTIRSEPEHRTIWRYALTLDAAPALFGVRDRFHYLSRGPDGVTTPGVPTGLAAGLGVPDGAGQWSVVPVTWDPPATNAQEIELWAQPVAGGADVFIRHPANARAGDIALAFLAPYALQARFWPYAGAPGGWCSPIAAVGGPPPDPPAPTDPALVESSFVPGGVGVLITWVLSDPPPASLQYEWNYADQGLNPWYALDTTDRIWLAPLDPGVDYVLRVRSVNRFGWVSQQPLVFPFTTPIYAPDPPTDLHVTYTGYTLSGTGWALIGFTPPGTTHGPHDTYEVRVHLGPKPLPTYRVPGDATALPVTDLDFGLIYTVDARSWTDSGWPGPWSDSVSVVVDPPNMLPVGTGYSNPDAPFAGYVASDTTLIALDATLSYRSGQSWVFTPPSGDSATLTAAAPLTVLPGTWLSYGFSWLGVDGDADLAGQLTLIWDLGDPTILDLTPMPRAATLTDDSGTPLTDDSGHPLITDVAWAYKEDQVQVPTGVKTLVLAAACFMGTLTGSLLIDLYHPPQPTKGAPQLTPGAVGDLQIAVGGITDPSRLALKTGPSGGYDYYDLFGILRGRDFYDSVGVIHRLGFGSTGQELQSGVGDTLFVGDPAGPGGIGIGSASGFPVTINGVTVDNAGVVRAGGYQSSDGTAGSTEDVTIGGVVFHYKDGLMTGHTP